MNAGRIAGSYRWLEYAAFGFTLERARFDFFLHATQARRVLILGEGDGRFLARLMDYNRHASIFVIETSARMIHLARCRLRSEQRSRVEFRQIDAVTGAYPDGFFDLAVTHFFLDVLDSCEAAAVIAKVTSQLSPGAYWLVSEFQVPAGSFRQMHARLWLRAMYAFFAAATGLRASKLPPYRDLLVRSGLVEMQHCERRMGLIRSQLWRKGI